MEMFVHIPLSVLSDERLSLSDVKVYAALVQLTPEKDFYSPTRKEIQQASGVQRVSRHTQNLLRCGHIQVSRHKSGNRNTYTLVAFSTGTSSPKEISFTVFQKEYFHFAEGELSPKTRRTYETAFREFVRINGDVLLNSIGIRQVEQFLSVKKVEASEWTSRKYYIALRSAFEKAVQWNFITENPFAKVKKPRVPELLPAYLTEKEFPLLLSAIAEKYFRELCIAAALTGMRLGELLSLKWSDVDFERKVIFVHNSESFRTKTQKNRVVPMCEDLFRLLMEMKASVNSESDIVFTDARGKQWLPGTASQKFKKAVRDAGLNDKLHFHSLRHSFASSLVASGVSLFKVQKLLGHTTSKTTEIYSHLAPQQLHEEVNTLKKLLTLPASNSN